MISIWFFDDREPIAVYSDDLPIASSELLVSFED